MAQNTLGIKLYLDTAAQVGDAPGVTGATDVHEIVKLDVIAPTYGLSYVAEKGVLIPNVMEIGELAQKGSGASSYDKIEVTTLADSKHMYIDGLQADADDGAQELGVKLLYDPAVFKAITALAGTFDTSFKKGDITSNDMKLVVEIPAGLSINGNKVLSTFVITAKHNSLALDGIAVNSALTMSWSVAVSGVTLDAPNAEASV